VLIVASRFIVRNSFRGEYGQKRCCKGKTTEVCLVQTACSPTGCAPLLLFVVVCSRGLAAALRACMQLPVLRPAASAILKEVGQSDADMVKAFTHPGSEVGTVGWPAVHPCHFVQPSGVRLA
jgi:hypothetical protein